MSDPLSIVHDEEKKPWFHEGLRFGCTQCGQCCTGSPGYAWVTLDEIVAIAAHLNLSIDDFAKRYLRQVGEEYALLEHPTTYDCVFLKEKKCQIYPVRPKQCRTFPWWKNQLESEEAWKEAAKRCEGINHPEAPTISCKAILQLLE
jgi:Fe-S-cluster containining protein